VSKPIAGEVEELDAEFEYLDLTGSTCPRCGVGEGLGEILYGLPAVPPDESKYLIGGCCVDENSPEVGCVECGWQGSYRLTTKRSRA
jgi:hypothetical protein